MQIVAGSEMCQRACMHVYLCARVHKHYACVPRLKAVGREDRIVERKIKGEEQHYLENAGAGALGHLGKTSG